LLPVATAALRDASNGAPLAESIAKALGTPVRLLSGIEEARLISRPSATASAGDAAALGMDLGGGLGSPWATLRGNGTTLPLGLPRAGAATR
jgi:exopolyphosphatase/pppGpp-phosphohydrolase